jgi:hypothetical protein
MLNVLRHWDWPKLDCKKKKEFIIIVIIVTGGGRVWVLKINEKKICCGNLLRV